MHLSHLGLPVRDVRRTLDFYEVHLNLTGGPRAATRTAPSSCAIRTDSTCPAPGRCSHVATGVPAFRLCDARRRPGAGDAARLTADGVPIVESDDDPVTWRSTALIRTAGGSSLLGADPVRRVSQPVGDPPRGSRDRDRRVVPPAATPRPRSSVRRRGCGRRPGSAGPPDSASRSDIGEPWFPGSESLPTAWVREPVYPARREPLRDVLRIVREEVDHSSRRRSTRARTTAVCAIEKVSNGGSSDVETTDVAVNPTGLMAPPSSVITVTPAGRRRGWDGIHVGVQAGRHVGCGLGGHGTAPLRGEQQSADDPARVPSHSVSMAGVSGSRSSSTVRALVGELAPNSTSRRMKCASAARRWIDDAATVTGTATTPPSAPYPNRSRMPSTGRCSRPCTPAWLIISRSADRTASSASSTRGCGRVKIAPCRSRGRWSASRRPASRTASQLNAGRVGDSRVREPDAGCRPVRRCSGPAHAPTAASSDRPADTPSSSSPRAARIGFTPSPNQYASSRSG